jgi:hypothetical protein
LVLLSIALFVLLSFVVVVDADSLVWSQTYGGVEFERAYSLVATSDGGYALAGSTSNNFWLIKTDASGDMEWNKTYGGENDDCATSLVVTSDGGYAIAGYYNGSGFLAGDYKNWLVKTDEFGNMEWNKTYGEPDDLIFRSVVETSDGGYALVCNELLVKTDEFGNVEWSKTCEGVTGRSLIETLDGGYAMAGYRFLVKTNEFGDVEWNQTYEGAYWYGGGSLIGTADGGYALAGAYNLIKTDEIGDVEWSLTYELEDVILSLVETADGGYVVAGYKIMDVGDFVEDRDMWVSKIDEFGTIEWEQTYGGEYIDEALSLVKTSDGGYALAGRTESFGAGTSDIWLIKTDENGVVPEYSSWLFPTLLLVATSVIIIYKKRG